MCALTCLKMINPSNLIGRAGHVMRTIQEQWAIVQEQWAIVREVCFEVMRQLRAKKGVN